MRGVSKQNTIKRARLKLIKIATFQNKAFASKRSEVGDRRLTTKANLKMGQMQNQAQEDSFFDPLEVVSTQAFYISRSGGL
jgi:hypothetical protein